MADAGDHCVKSAPVFETRRILANHAPLTRVKRLIDCCTYVPKYCFRFGLSCGVSM